MSTNFVRLVLKISGESLKESGSPSNFNFFAIRRIIKGIVALKEKIAVQVAVMVGGGNILRGSSLSEELRFRTIEKKCAADDLGMLATYINGGALFELMEDPSLGLEPRLMLARPFGEIGEPFYRKKAVSHLNKGRVVILAGGTGNPRCTTDYAAVLRACELGADLVIKGTKVPGIFSSDPMKAPSPGESVKHYPRLTYDQFIEHKPSLGILDATAVTLARENSMLIRVCKISEPGALVNTIIATGSEYSEIGPDRDNPTEQRLVDTCVSRI